MKIAILDSFPADQGADGWWAGCGATGDDIVIYPRTPPELVTERAAGAAVVLTNKVRFTAEVFASLPDLRHLAVCATGFNIIDVPAAIRAGVTVSNVPGYSTTSVAQLVFAFILERACALREHDALVKGGGWRGDFTVLAHPVHELAGRTLVVVGRGAIGSAVARFAESFAMRVIAASVPGSSSPGRMPLAEALAQAHAVTLHCPLTEATAGLAGPDFFAALQPGALLVNTGRGQLIDEAALVEALRSGRLGAFCGDVLAVEPPRADHPLCAPDWGTRVLLTPHIGWASVEARLRLRDEVVANLAAWRRGENRNRVA